MCCTCLHFVKVITSTYRTGGLHSMHAHPTYIGYLRYMLTQVVVC